MAHILIAGRTLHGKSILSQMRCRAFRAQGIQTIVIDPTMSPDWNAHLQFRDQESFLRAYWASKQCAVFFDEGSKSIGRYNSAMEETATVGRHRGHINHYIVQRAVQVPLTLRDQCTELFLFSSSHKDGAAMADDFGFDELRECNSLRKGEYFHASLETKTCERCSLWTQPRTYAQAQKERENALATSDNRWSVSGDRAANRRAGEEENDTERSGENTRGNQKSTGNA